jgi:DnaJ-domain-containing protein 1
MTGKLVFLLVNGILIVLLFTVFIREYVHQKFRLSIHHLKEHDDGYQPDHSSDAKRNPTSFKDSMNCKMTAEIACQILGLHSINDQQQVKKAYHELVKKYHPDHVSYLGSEFQKMAEDKTRNINLAYHVIIRQLENNQRKASGNSFQYH